MLRYVQTPEIEKALHSLDMRVGVNWILNPDAVNRPKKEIFSQFIDGRGNSF